MTLTLRFEFSIPQLLTLGNKIMASLSSITTALDNLSTVLDAELTAIADALQNSPSQEEVDVVAVRVMELRDRIANIIP